MCKYLQKGIPHQNGPPDFRFAFELQVNGKNWTFFVKSAHEQETWVSEFQKHQTIQVEEPKIFHLRAASEQPDRPRSRLLVDSADYKTFTDGNFVCYTSQYLSMQQMTISGQLYVKSKNSLKNYVLLNKQAFSWRTVIINFTGAQITMLNEDIVKNLQKDIKIFHFNQLQEVTK